MSKSKTVNLTVKVDAKRAELALAEELAAQSNANWKDLLDLLDKARRTREAANARLLKAQEACLPQ